MHRTNLFYHATIFLAFGAFSLNAGILLRGGIVDQQNKPLANVIVSLANNGLSDTTDTSGSFLLASSILAVKHQRMTFETRSALHINKSAIVLLTKGNEQAALSIYTLLGARVSNIERSPGSDSRVALSTSRLAQGTYLIKVTLGSLTRTIKYCNSLSTETVRYDLGDAVASSLSKVRAASADSVLDTLVISRQGFSRKGIPLTSLIDTTITVRIDSVGPVRFIESTTAGGLWYDPKTWIGGVIPNATNDVLINGQVFASVSGADTSSCRNMTIAPGGILRAESYNARILTIYGDLVNKGDVRNGPDFASYDNALLTVRLAGNLVQDSLYRPIITYLIGDNPQTFSTGPNDYLAGDFVDSKPASPILAGSDLVFRSFTLTFDSASAAGVLDMGNNQFRLASGSFVLGNGSLRTSNILCDSLTNFTCPRIRSAGGPTIVKGVMRTANAQFDSSLVIDSGAVFFNQGYIDAVVIVKGDFTNKGLTRRGPGFAAYGEGNLAMTLEKDFYQAGTYTVQLTRFTTASTHTVGVDSGSILQGIFYNDAPAADIVASTSIRFRDFSLDFGTTNGRLVMGNKVPRIIGGAFIIKGGALVTSVIQGDSLTSFTCRNVHGAAGLVTLKGTICTDTTIFDSDLIVDTGAIFYNKGYTEAVVTVKGNFTNNGLTRRGPGFAAYGEGNLAMLIEKNFRQNGTYVVQLTRFTGTTEQTIGTDSGKVLQGLFYDDTPLSGLKATTELIINEAKFVLSPDTINKGSLSMDTFRLYHPTGNLQIDSGSLQADSITGGVDGYTTFTIPKITTKSGSVTINKHYRTTSCAIDGTLIVDNDGIFYNQGYITAYVTDSGTTVRGKMGSGPGVPSYGDGQLFLNGTLLALWR